MKLDLPDDVFELSQRRIRGASHYRIVDIRAHDGKTYDDNRPRIRRSNDRLRPMQQVVMDVKVIDCCVRRTDGSVAWPRMVAFMDAGTHRIFRRFFLLKTGEGIRQEHVVATFLDMVSDSEWGFPEQIYRDNGSEFEILDKIRGALDQLRGEDVRTIINARPYAAASKPIESKFAVLDRFVFSQMGGWAGGNRLRLKTHQLGQRARPYTGSFDDFVKEANERVDVFEGDAIGSGPFAGRSPRGTFGEYVAKGWRALLVSTGRLDAAFCTRETRRVRRGYVKIGGELYRHPEFVTGKRIAVAIPWRRCAKPLASVGALGWVSLTRDELFPPTSMEGARESHRRARQNEDVTRAMKREAGTIDLEANRRDQLSALEPQAIPVTFEDRDILPDERSLAAALPLTRETEQSVSHSAVRRRKTERLEELLATVSK